jgi:hypothetical protein
MYIYEIIGILFIIVVLTCRYLYKYYCLYGRYFSNKEGLQNRDGYITQMRKYFNKHVYRPLRLQKDELVKNVGHIKQQLSHKFM